MTKSTYRKGREYQEETANYFRALGYDVEVETTIKAARGEYDIDIWVTFSEYGIDQKWAVECKNWKGPVKKGDVASFIRKVQDIGAHAGFMVSARGFQSGAYDVAQKTNIHLTSLEELRVGGREGIVKKWSTSAMERVIDLKLRCERSIAIDAVHHRLNRPIIYNGEVSLPYSMKFLQMMEQALNEGRKGNPPGLFVIIPQITGPNTWEPVGLAANDMSMLMIKGEQFIREAERHVKRSEEAIAKLKQSSN
jgi:hypothetical protein